MDGSLSAFFGADGSNSNCGEGDLARGAQQQAAQREERQGEESGENDLLHEPTIAGKIEPGNHGEDRLDPDPRAGRQHRLAVHPPGMRTPLSRLEAGLPASWYYDPAHYRRELETFWY